MEPMPINFTTYLSERLGLNPAETNALLGAWLKEYEPLCCGTEETPSRVTGSSEPLAPPEQALQQTA
jgi:hypothetical protein